MGLGFKLMCLVALWGYKPCMAEQDSWTHLMRKTSRQREMKSVQIDADGTSELVPSGGKSEHLLAATPGDEKDDLPEAYDADAIGDLEISAEHKKAGKELLKGTYGALATLFVKSATDLSKYWAKVIQRANGGTDPLNVTRELPSKEQMKSLMSGWRTELLKFSTCPEDPLDMEACMGATRCLLEKEVGTSITAAFFAAFMEIQVEVENVIIRDFEFYFKETKTTPVPECPGESEALHANSSLIDQSEASSERQWRAVSAVFTIQRAAELMERAAAPLSHADLADFKYIWQEPCSALGCDHGSFQDIVQTMHGHVAELVEVGAPAAAIREYVRAMRKAIRAQKAYFGHASLLQDFELVFGKNGRNVAANKRYNQQFKNVGGMLDGAYMVLQQSNERLTTFFWCFTVFAGGLHAYVKKFPSPASDWGVILSIVGKYGISSSILNSLLSGNGVCSGVSSAVAIGAVVGYVPGTPKLVCFRAGLALTASVSWNNCKNSFNLGITAAMSGSMVWTSTQCPFGSDLGMFKCVQGVTVGVGLICCNFNLRSGAASCR